MERVRRKVGVSGGSGEGGYAVIIVSKYWPPPKLIKDLAMRQFGVTRVDPHVVEPPHAGTTLCEDPHLKKSRPPYHEGDTTLQQVFIKSIQNR